MLKNSLKQMGRSKSRTIAFLLLLILAVTFLSLGVNLWQACNRNMEEYEKVFMTVGVVNQKENAVKVTESWDASIKEYTYWDEAVYDSILPISLLNFEGANYVIPPEQRPYYGAYSPGIKIWPADEEENSIREWGAIIEFVPYADNIPRKPIKVKVTKVLWGSRREGEDILLCDQFNDNPGMMEAGKTYITAIQSWPIPFKDTEYELLPYANPYNPTISTQKNKKGERIGEEKASFENWVEVTDHFYETEEGEKWEELAGTQDRFIKHTFPVVPTNRAGLLMDFHQKNAFISDGRDITDKEYENGEKVCIVPQRFATKNGLKVGDRLNLQLYFSDYERSASQTYYPSGTILLDRTLINAEGKAYPVFEDSEYEIVGIYSGASQTNNPTGYEMGYNAVVIPARSVKNSDENNIIGYGPMKGYTTSFQIPNGATRMYLEKFKALGLHNLEVNFYDGGYEKLALGMRNLMMVALILMSVSGATTLAVLFFFVFLFISKQKKRTAIERSLGMSKEQCTWSMLYGIFAVISSGGIIGSFIGFMGTGLVLSDSMKQEAELYSKAFSNWVNNADTVATHSAVDVSVNPMSSIFLYLIVLLVSLLIALILIKNNLKEEPLALLSRNED